MKRLFIILITLLSLLLVPAETFAQAVPRFEPLHCPSDLAQGADLDCGYLIVPADYEEPEGPTLKLLVVIIHSRDPNPAPDPILFTEGGPGYSSIVSVPMFANSTLVDDRDMVILEQRGNKHSIPALVCDFSVWVDESQGNTACLDSLLDQGIDLTHFSGAAIAADLDSLRQVLPYEQWNLYGTSYSTRLMQLTMRTRPEDIRSVTLQATLSLTETRYEHDPEHPLRSLQLLFDDCAADPECSAAYPDLEAQFFELFQRLNDEPVPFELADIVRGEVLEETVDGHRMLGWMVWEAFYRPAFPPNPTAYLPLLINEVNKGRTELLQPWLAHDLNNIINDSDFAWGLYFAVNCQDDAPRISEEEVAAQKTADPRFDGYYRHERELEICRAWDLPAADPLVTAPIESDIPTLIMVGAYDPITPPAWSQALAAELPNSHYQEFRSFGHNLGDPCNYNLINNFLDDPYEVPDAACLNTHPNPTFAKGEEILYLPSFYEYFFRYIGFSLTEHRIYLILEQALTYVMVLAPLPWLVMTIIKLRKRGKARPAKDWVARLGQPLAILVNIGYFGLTRLTRNLSHDLARNQYVLLRFGVPADSWPTFALALLLALLSAALAILVVVVWRRRTWTLLERILFTVAALVPIAFSIFIANWGWLSVFFP